MIKTTFQMTVVQAIVKRKSFGNANENLVFANLFVLMVESLATKHVMIKIYLIKMDAIKFVRSKKDGSVT